MYIEHVLWGNYVTIMLTSHCMHCVFDSAVPGIGYYPLSLTLTLFAQSRECLLLSHPLPFLPPHCRFLVDLSSRDGGLKEIVVNLIMIDQ